MNAAQNVGSIETRTSWVLAGVAVAILSVTYGSPLVVVVAMKAIAADLGAPREVPALAAAMSWFGAGLGATKFVIPSETLPETWAKRKVPLLWYF